MLWKRLLVVTKRHFLPPKHIFAMRECFLLLRKILLVRLFCYEKSLFSKERLSLATQWPLFAEKMLFHATICFFVCYNFTSFIVLIGIGIVAIPTGLLASAIREVKLKKSKSK